jgi:hypothetical protein
MAKAIPSHRMTLQACRAPLFATKSSRVRNGG